MTVSRDSNLTGTAASDLLDGGSGSDTIYGGFGSDIALGGSGHDIVFGGSGSDLVDGGSGNDFVNGDAGSDIVFGGAGHDTVNGGGGYDLVFANAGNDILIYSLSENIGRSDYYDGGSGFDTLEVYLTSGQWATSAIQASIRGFQDFLEGAPGQGWSCGGDIFGFDGFNLAVSDIEAVRIFVDGVLADLTDQAVLLADDSFTLAGGDLSVSGNVLANDLVPDGVQSLTLATNPGLGAVQLDGAGNLTYTLDAGLNTYRELAVGQVLLDEFFYAVVDTDGDSGTARVSVLVTGVNDAPVVQDRIYVTSVSEDASFAGLVAPAYFTLNGRADDIDSDDDASTLSYAFFDPVSSGGTFIEGMFPAYFPNDLQFAPGSDFQHLSVGESEFATIRYNATDSHGAVSNTGTLEFEIVGSNDAPILGIGLLAAQEGGAAVTLDLAGLGEDVDSDDDGTTLTYAIVGQPSLGSVVLNGTLLSFDPDGDFAYLNDGEIETVSILVSATDRHGASVTTEMQVTVSGVTQGGAGDLDIFTGGVGSSPAVVYLNDAGSYLAVPTTLQSTLDAETGDLDSDGDLDMFIANGNAAGVYLNTGSGVFTFNGQNNLAIGQTLSTALGDLDGDGDLDALVGRQSNVGDLVLFNDGSGQFSVGPQLLGIADDTTFEVALGDIDSDGDLDIWTANAYGAGAADKLFFNDGSGGFTQSSQSLDLFDSTDVDFADLDNDGDLDTFVTNGGYSVAQGNTIWLNDGTGQFTDSGQALGDKFHTGVDLGDLDGDGDIDAFVVVSAGQYSGAGNQVWLNDGAGNFTVTAQVLGAANSEAVALGDMDGDGDLDAVVANMGSPDVLYLNDGAGSFVDSGLALGGNELSYSVVLGDFDLL